MRGFLARFRRRQQSPADPSRPVAGATHDGGPAQIRVLSVIPSVARNTGGPAINLMQATRALAPDVRRTFYCTDSGRPAASRGFVRLTRDELPDGADLIDLHVFTTRRPHSFAFSPSLFRAIGRNIHKYDLVTIHSLNLFPQFAAYYHARRSGTPYVVTPHGALDPWLRSNSPLKKAVVNRLWQKGMLEHAAALHFTAQAESELVDGVAPGVPRWVVPNGLDVEQFNDPPSPDDFRRDFLRGHDGPLVLFLGRVARKKGLDLLISAFAQASVGGSAMLAIVGPDDEELVPVLRSQAAELHVADRVRFLGPLYGEPRRAALATADIWALTSHTENFGNAVLEAMACGLPVIVSTAVNISREIQAASAGVVTGLDVGEIARRLESLVSDAGLRRELGQHARTFAARYDWSEVAPQLARMYRFAAFAGDGAADSYALRRD